MPTVLLTGGSGFVGHWIARALPAQYRLRVLARPTSDLSLLDATGRRYERASGDLRDYTATRTALEGVAALIHAAGTISFDRAARERVWANNVEATRVLWAAAHDAGVGRVVHTASIFALGHAPEGVPVGPAHPFNGWHLLDIPYVRAKWEIELHSREMLRRGLPLVRLYPGLCLGPEDRSRSSSGMIGEWLRGRLPALVEGGICFVDVRDAAAAHVAALERGTIGNQYLLPGSNLSHRALFERLSPLAGRAPPRLILPPRLALWGVGLLERLLPAPPLRRDITRLMLHRWWYRDDSARLGIAYRPLEETLHATVRELQTAHRPPG